MRVDWVGVRVRWGMYGVRVCVAAKVRMIPLPILPPNHRLPGKKVYGSERPIKIFQIFIKGFTMGCIIIKKTMVI